MRVNEVFPSTTASQQFVELKDPFGEPSRSRRTSSPCTAAMAASFASRR
jgi:hypothetical protein